MWSSASSPCIGALCMDWIIDMIGSNNGINCDCTKELIALSTAFLIASSDVAKMLEGPVNSADEADTNPQGLSCDPQKY